MKRGDEVSGFEFEVSSCKKHGDKSSTLKTRNLKPET
jgi:hypothetical protein